MTKAGQAAARFKPAGPQGGTALRRRFRWKDYKIGTLYFLPFFLLFTLFTIVPIVVSIATSLTNYDLFTTPSFIGLTNYRLLFMKDDVFWISLRNTLVFVAISFPVGYLMSFLMAWLINQTKRRAFFSLAFYVPSITSGVAMATVWMYFFSPDRYGLINNMLFQLGIINEPVLWNLDPQTIMPVVIIISIWQSMGNGFLVFLAGLQGLPEELYEAGAIDGIRTRTQELFYITLPQMKPQLLFGSINALMLAFSVFDVSVVVAGMPSPNYAGHTIVALLYDSAFTKFEMGYASAAAVVLFLITFGTGRVFMRLLSSD